MPLLPYCKVFLIFLLSCLLTSSYLAGCAQGAPADPGKGHEQQIRHFKSLSERYTAGRDYKKAHFYIEKSIAIAAGNHIDTLAGELLNYNGYVYQLEDDYDAAVSNYQNALNIFTKLKQKQQAADACLNIGICEMKRSEFGLANSYYFKSAYLYLELKDLAYLSTAYNSIASCYQSLNNKKQALTYFRQALSLRLKLKNRLLIAQSFNNIGYAFKENNQPDSAILYLSRCMDLRRDQKDSSILVLTLQNLGVAWKMKGDFKKAEDDISHSLRIAAGYHMQEEIARGNLDLANLYLAQNKNREALAAVNITQHSAAQLKLPELLRDAYDLKYSFYLKQAQYQQALFYNNKMGALNDSLFSIAQTRVISELEIKYQTAQKEKDIAALNAQNLLQQQSFKQQRVIITVLVIAAVLLLLLFAIAYHSFRIKNKSNQRIQTLLKDLHHRVKNNLQILSGLFSMQIDNLSDGATKNTLRENEARLTSMNLIHNKLYMDHATTAIEMNEYLTKLLQHIKGSFGGDKISLIVDVDHVKLEADKAVAIGLIVNELATNAFKYAFDNQPGEIYLNLKQQGKSKIQLTLADTGKGISALGKEKDISFGLKLVNLMSRQLGATMIVETTKGTRYFFEISI